VSTDKYANISQTLGDLHKNVLSEVKTRQRKIDNARQAVIKAAEEKKAMIAAAANAKKKNNNKNKKSKDEPKVDEEEEKKELAKPAEAEPKELDLTNPAEFKDALVERAPRPFTFGPIEFNGLNLNDDQTPFDGDSVREIIIDNLD
jgi:hypothetical protein